VIFATDYPFLDVLWTLLVFFAGMMWIGLFIVAAVDVFGRTDLSGWGKGGWIIFMVLLPFLGVLVYVVRHGSDLGGRRHSTAVEQRDGARRGAEPGRPTTAIADAKHLLDTGAINQDEFDQLKRKALA
jgi:hypothetical protein